MLFHNARKVSDKLLKASPLLLLVIRTICVILSLNQSEVADSLTWSQSDTYDDDGYIRSQTSYHLWNPQIEGRSPFAQCT
jgi:hypothetical protein